MIYITLNKVRDHSPCHEGWTKLLSHLGKTKADDEPLSMVTVLDSNGLGDALWCLRALPEYNKQWRLFAVWCARKVQHIMTDPRNVEVLDVAERFANGEATREELKAAGDDAAATAYAYAYADAAYAAYYAASATAFAHVAHEAELRRVFTETEQVEE